VASACFFFLVVQALDSTDHQIEANDVPAKLRQIVSIVGRYLLPSNPSLAAVDFVGREELSLAFEATVNFQQTFLQFRQ